MIMDLLIVRSLFGMVLLCQCLPTILCYQTKHPSNLSHEFRLTPHTVLDYYPIRIALSVGLNPNQLL